MVKMKLLVCVGGERPVDIAAGVACDISGAMDAEMTLLNVSPRVSTHYHMLKHGVEARTPKDITEIIEITTQILKRKGIEKIKSIRKRGEPVREILRESDKGYSMVITCTKVLTRGIERFFFGSISHEVAEYAKIPVLVIKKDTHLKNLLVCTDGSDHSEEAEYCCGYLAKRLGANVTILAVSPANKEVKKFEERAIGKGKKMLKKEFGIVAKGKVKVGKSVSKAILKDASNYDLVILGSRGLSRIKRLLLGHVSLKVLEKAKTNVLIVRHCIAYEKRLK